MSAAQPVNVPKNVQQKLPECEAYVESLSLSPEQKQMFAQAARNRLSTTPKIFRGRRATLEAMAMASTSPLQQMGGMHEAASVPAFLPSPQASVVSLQSNNPLFKRNSVNKQQQQQQTNQQQQQRQPKSQGSHTSLPQVVHPEAPRAVESHARPQRGFP